MLDFDVMKNIIIKHIVNSDDITTILKVELLSYLFFQLCWDFDYYKIIGDFEK